MPVNLSVKNVADHVAEKLRLRAKANNLQDELLAVLKDAVSSPRRLSAAELLQTVRKSDLRSPREAAASIRAMRDAS